MTDNIPQCPNGKFSIKRIDSGTTLTFVVKCDLSRKKKYPKNNTVLLTDCYARPFSLKVARTLIRLQNKFYKKTGFKYKISYAK